jgi:hypothetical protein
MHINNILVELSSILVLLCVPIGITINTPIFKYVYPKIHDSCIGEKHHMVAPLWAFS